MRSVWKSAAVVVAVLAMLTPPPLAAMPAPALPAAAQPARSKRPKSKKAKPHKTTHPQNRKAKHK